MKHKKRILCLMLCLLMLIPGFTSCQEKEQTNPANSDAAADTVVEETVPETEEEPVDERLLVADNLPEKKFDGQNFTLYLRDEVGRPPNDFVAEEGSGDILVDAVYRRNLNISERFDVNFAYNFDISGNTTYETSAVLSIRAGEDINDLLGLHGAFCFNYASQGLLLDWNEYMTYNDLNKPWWDTDFKNNMSIAGKLFGMTGNISYTSIGGTFCLMFNKGILSDAGIAYPYDAVRDGSWTFEMFRTMSSEATRDINGDGQYTGDDDQFGLYSGSWAFPICAFYMAGDKVIGPNDEGVLSLTMYNERTASLMETLMGFYKEPGVYIADHHGPGRALFEENRALFLGASMSTLHSARDYDVDLGVVPYPKYDESVSRYYSLVDAGENVFCVPVTAERTEMISIITEALAAEGYKIVVPAFYEIGLKAKYARDEDTAEMLEIITASRHFDYGYFDASINRGFSYIGRTVLFDNVEFTSYHKSNQNAAEAMLKKLYENYTD